MAMLGSAGHWLGLSCFSVALMLVQAMPEVRVQEQPAPVQCLAEIEGYLVRVRTLTRTTIDPKVSEHLVYEYSYGTGVLIGDDGTIVTAGHLLHSRHQSNTAAEDVAVMPRSSRNYLPVELVAEDLASDVALLRMNPRALPQGKHLAIGTPRFPGKGERSYIAGLRAGAPPDSFEIGIVGGAFVDASRRMEELAGGRKLGPGPWITVSQMILPGYSGGPILDASGDLVGIVGGAPELKGKWVEFSYGTGIEAVMRLRDRARGK